MFSTCTVANTYQCIDSIAPISLPILARSVCWSGVAIAERCSILSPSMLNYFKVDPPEALIICFKSNRISTFELASILVSLPNRQRSTSQNFGYVFTLDGNSALCTDNAWSRKVSLSSKLYTFFEADNRMQGSRNRRYASPNPLPVLLQLSGL